MSYGPEGDQLPKPPIVLKARTWEGQIEEINALSVHELLGSFLRPEAVPLIDGLEEVLKTPTSETLERVSDPQSAFFMPTERQYLLSMVVNLATGMTLPANVVQDIAISLDSRWEMNEDWVKDEPNRRWFESLTPDQQQSELARRRSVEP